MSSIPPDLYKRLRDTLLRCGPLNNESEVRSLFSDKRIVPWRDRLTLTGNSANRVREVISVLLQHENVEHDNALVLFLHVLCDQVHPDDACHSDLSALADELEHTLELEALAESLDAEEPSPPPQSHRLSQDILERVRRYLPFKLYNNLLVYPGTESETQCTEHLKALLQTVLTYRAAPIFEEASPYPDQVQGRWVDATLLFADVSGFTGMSEKLTNYGRAGVERITDIVRGYFATMVNVLHENGGFVLRFSGDALLGMFLGQTAITARSAVQAALNMQRKMSDSFREVETPAGRFKLQMKVGIHAGRVFAAHVGTASQMEYWVTGEVVNMTAVAAVAASEAEAVFEKGEQVVGSASVTKHLTAWGKLEHPPEDPEAEYTISSALREQLYLIPKTRVYDQLETRPILVEKEISENIGEILARLDTLVPYLPKGLLPHLVSNPYDRKVESEHRLVAVLFINVIGFSELAADLGTAHTQELIATMQDYFDTVYSIIDNYGGVLNKIDLYNEGDKILAIFGAPKSNEDDADNAARAALEIQAALTLVNQRLLNRCPDVKTRLCQRIGLSTGFVFSGNVGTDFCQEYTIMGNNVNLAARLMAKANWGEVWVSEHAYYWLEPFCHFEPLQEHLKLKGIAGLVSAYRLKTMYRTYRPQPRFVDRCQAQEILQGALAQLETDKTEGRIVIVSGDPGIGKSRLLAEVEQFAEGQSVRYLMGRCHAQGATYKLFAEMLRQCLNVEEGDDLETQRNILVQKIVKLFGAEQVSQKAPFLAIVMGLPLLKDWETCVAVMGEHLSARLADETAAFFRRLAEDAPLLLVCEDLQWLNQHTAVLLLKIIELAGYMPIMIGLTSYPGTYPVFESVVNKIRSRLGFLLDELVLEPLEASHCGQLVSDILGREVSADRNAYIYERSQGNPLLVVEIARAIYADPDIELSPSAYHMIESRIDGLSDSSRQTLRAASIIGTEFSLDELFYIMKGISGSKIRQDLSDLRNMHLISKQVRNYRFVHTLTQEVVYNSQSLEKRKSYHRRLADYWEYENNLGKAANHYFIAEEWDAALRLSERAAEQYAKSYEYPEAIQLYEQALQASEKSNDQSALQRINHQLGKVFFMSSNYEKAEQAYTRELGILLQKLADGLAQAEVHAALGQVYDRWGRYEDALFELGQGLRLAGSAPTIIHVQLLRVRCSALRSIGEHEKAIESGKEAIQVARTVGSREEEAYANNNLGAVYGEQGQIPLALECHQRALELRRELGDRYGEEQSLNNVALCYIRMEKAEQVEQAEATFAEALKIQQEIGDRVGEGSTYHNLGRIDSYIKKQYEIAEAKFQQALEIWSRIDYRKGIAFVHHDLGAEVYFKQNRWDKAREHLELAITAYEEMGIKQHLPDAYKALGEVSSKQNLWDEAREHLETAITAYEEMDDKTPEKQSLPEAYLAIAPVYRALGLTPEALAAAQKARDSAREIKNSRLRRSNS